LGAARYAKHRYEGKHTVQVAVDRRAE
jgi:hypothetical protein